MRILPRAVRLAIFLAVCSCLRAGAAHAGTVDLTEARTAPGSDQATLTLVNSLSEAIGGVQLIVTGAAGFSFNAGSNLSLPDSSYLVDAFPGLDLLKAFSPAGISLADPGQSVLLGTFTLPSGASPLTTLIPFDAIAVAYSTILDTQRNAFNATDHVTIACAFGAGDCPITLRVTISPEPSVLAFLVAAAALALFAAKSLKEDSP